MAQGRRVGIILKARLLFAAAAVVAAAFAGAQRMPSVSYAVSGSSGNWTLDFTLTSNFLSGEGDFYFFGVRLGSGRNIAGSPANWDPNSWTSWDNAAYGGSSTVYNNNWINFTSTGQVQPGQSLSGFQAVSTDAVAPTSVQWFAYAFNGTYGGNDNFNNPGNPGFEGVARAVPEPASMAALGLGVAALLRRRRK